MLLELGQPSAQPALSRAIESWWSHCLRKTFSGKCSGQEGAMARMTTRIGRRSGLFVAMLAFACCAGALHASAQTTSKLLGAVRTAW